MRSRRTANVHVKCTISHCNRESLEVILDPKIIREKYTLADSQTDI